MFDDVSQNEQWAASVANKVYMTIGKIEYQSTLAFLRENGCPNNVAPERGAAMVVSIASSS